MAKIRKTASIENGIMQVLKILNEDEIQETIGKSSSYLRKCSDPSQQQQIDHNDSIKLDIACIKIVDLPIPGSPPTKVTEPLTIPPPNTLSNSII